MSRWFSRIAQIFKLKIKGEEKINVEAVVGSERPEKRSRVVHAALKHQSSAITPEATPAKQKRRHQSNVDVQVDLDLNFITDPANELRHQFSEEDFHEVSAQLEWNHFEPEVHAVQWLNVILEKFWSLSSASLQNYLNKCVDKNGDFNGFEKWIDFPNIFLGIRKVQCSFGKKSPLVTGVRVLKRGVKRNQVIIDVEITYGTDLDVMFTGYYKLNFGVERFYCRFLLRIVLGPLIRETPTVATVSFTLFKQPIISWKLTGFPRCLNSNILQSFVEQFLIGLYGNPNKFEITIAASVPYKEIKLKEPLGVFRVDVIEATRLPRSNTTCCGVGKPNTYCVVQYESQMQKTQVISDSYHPEWHRSFIFLYTETEQKSSGQIQFLLYCEEIDEDELIGTFKVPVDLFIQSETVYNGRLFITSLLEPNTNSFVNKGRAGLTFRISYFSLRTKIEASSVVKSKNLPLAVLCVLIDYATGLETVAHQVKSPELRSLVRVSVGNQAQVTGIKERTGYPVWEENLNFFLFEPRLEDVYIEVVDMYYVTEKSLLSLSGERSNKGEKQDFVLLSRSGKVVGYLTLPVTNVVNAFEKKTDNIYQLEGFVENGHIRVLTSLRYTVDSPAVMKNFQKIRVTFPEDEKQLEEVEKKDVGKTTQDKGATVTKAN
ncbi:hypothetical protein B4U80_04109 [Leptotrombidium deliense]|uniref:C2 domain-containing protein n=1 Tax=Leptotrombidium deliense TaxID=299467 RepID=A0A443SF53_9ACAR|nr:hypothetical protein B4U80_04109 [Leptotrombidium deliense]